MSSPFGYVWSARSLAHPSSSSIYLSNTFMPYHFQQIGNKIRVVKNSSDGWMRGETVDGRSGWFPSNHIRVQPVHPAPQNAGVFGNGKVGRCFAHHFDPPLAHYVPIAKHPLDGKRPYASFVAAAATHLCYHLEQPTPRRSTAGAAQRGAEPRPHQHNPFGPPPGRVGASAPTHRAPTGHAGPSASSGGASRNVMGSPRQRQQRNK